MLTQYFTHLTKQADTRYLDPKLFFHQFWQVKTGFKFWDSHHHMYTMECNYLHSLGTNVLTSALVACATNITQRIVH